MAQRSLLLEASITEHLPFQNIISLMFKHPPHPHPKKSEFHFIGQENFSLSSTFFSQKVNQEEILRSWIYFPFSM